MAGPQNPWPAPQTHTGPGFLLPQERLGSPGPLPWHLGCAPYSHGTGREKQTLHRCLPHGLGAIIKSLQIAPLSRISSSLEGGNILEHLMKESWTGSEPL